MKIKTLSIAAVVMVALVLVVLLNQNSATAQPNNAPADCPKQFTPQANTKLDKSTLTLCGVCDIYTVREGWTADQGIAAKYEITTTAYAAYEVTCKSSTGSNCTAIAVSDVECPEPPADLGASATGTGTGGCGTGNCNTN